MVNHKIHKILTRRINTAALKESGIIKDINNVNQDTFLCFAANPCQGITCPKGKKCEVQNGKPNCVCNPNCKDTFKRKVCGTDQTSYVSECALRWKACQSDQNIGIDYYHECKGMLYVLIVLKIFSIICVRGSGYIEF